MTCKKNVIVPCPKVNVEDVARVWIVIYEEDSLIVHRVRPGQKKLGCQLSQRGQETVARAVRSFMQSVGEALMDEAEHASNFAVWPTSGLPRWQMYSKGALLGKARNFRRALPA